MASTDTKEPSVISKALNIPWEQRAAQKSVRIRQADEATFAADRAAGLAADRRADKSYKKQQERAVKAVVDQYVKGKGGNSVPDDDDAVYQDLGDRYQEIHHHHGKRESGNSALGKALPWVLAALMGPLGAAAAGWWFSEPKDEVNVKDVQSAVRVEVYDESGTLLETLPYNKLPKK